MREKKVKLYVDFYEKGKGSCKTLIGKITCPKCGNKKIKVFNDNGIEGDHLFHQVVNHFSRKNDIGLCPASKMFLRDLSSFVNIKGEES